MPDLVILLYDDVLLGRLVARRVGVGVEGHVCGDGVPGDEARQRADLREEADLVHLQRGGQEGGNATDGKPMTLIVNTYVWDYYSFQEDITKRAITKRVITSLELETHKK